ncbi:MAG TPA: DUF4157 domain-containing protein [Thermoanaerobaculia bacterium]|nr:DUF4157 domain-containing protein [Thermoanaerobaculia bacterium]
MNVSDELQARITAAGAKLRIGYPWWLRALLAKDVIAITLGRRIYVLPAYLERPQRDVERLIRHELVHVQQVVRLTLPLFLIRYAGEFVWHFARTRSFSAAYHAISFEREAYAAEEGMLS